MRTATESTGSRPKSKSGDQVGAKVGLFGLTSSSQVQSQGNEGIRPPPNFLPWALDMDGKSPGVGLRSFWLMVGWPPSRSTGPLLFRWKRQSQHVALIHCLTVAGLASASWNNYLPLPSCRQSANLDATDKQRPTLKIAISCRFLVIQVRRETSSHQCLMMDYR